MKGKKKWLENNRGAALVSVMIAVAFIAILASTLLYMAYSNYQMKVINYESKVNFYGTEHDMTELSTTIRNDVMKASNPLGQLKTMVGFVALDPANQKSGRYDPSSLARLVYSSLPAGETSFNIDGNRNYNTSGRVKVTFDTAITTPTVPNFTIVPDPGLDGILGTTDDDNGITQLVTLEDVIIKQENLDTGYVNKIQTDIVYRIKESPQSGDSGVGDFSMIMDSPLDTVTTGPARVTMYGSIMLGSGEYKVQTDTRTEEQGKLEGVAYAYVPSSNGTKPALHLKGETIFTLVGDHIIIMGDIVLEDNAILNVVSGRMTVCGDIYVLEKSCFMCTGDVLFPYGCKPNDATKTYGTTVINPGLRDSVTNDLLDNGKTDNILVTGDVDQLSKDNYKGLLTSLGLTDNDSTNDGVLDKLFLSTPADADGVVLSDYKDITGTKVLKTDGEEYAGIKYKVVLDSNDGQAINASDVTATLALYMDAGSKFNDGSNLNTTFISLHDFKFSNDKAYLFSQIGNSAFNLMLEEEIKKPTSDAKIKVGDMFVSNPNKVMNTIVNYAADGGSSAPTVETAVGYVNWIKE